MEKDYLVWVFETRKRTGGDGRAGKKEGGGQKKYFLQTKSHFYLIPILGTRESAWRRGRVGSPL